MSMPSSFDIGRQVGNNFANVRREAKDEGAIDQILSEAMSSGDPAILQNSIGKILSQVSPERQGVAVQFLQNKMQTLEAKQAQERKRVGAQTAGINPDLPESLQKVQYEHNLQNQQLQGIIGGGNGSQQGAAAQVPGAPGAQPPSPGMTTNQTPPQERGGNQQGFQYKDLSDEQLVQLRGLPAFKNQADSELKRRQEQNKAKKPGDEFASIREKSIADYVNNGIAAGEEAESLRFSLDEARKALQGDITGPGLKALAKNNPYTQLLVGLTPDESLLQAANKKLLEGSKGIFGSKPTEREIFLLLNSMLPSIGKTKEANLAGLNFIERVNDLKLMHSQLISDITEGGTKFIPDLERQVNAKMRPLAETLRKDLAVAVEALDESEKENKSPKGKAGQIKVKSPDGKVGFMSQENIDKAKANNVIFTPV